MSFIGLSKGPQDGHFQTFARGAGAKLINQNDFDYDRMPGPIAFRGITKREIIKRCWADQRDFYYMDTGYLGNMYQPTKKWHRIVKNDLQHVTLPTETLPEDRWNTLVKQNSYLTWPGWKKNGSKILLVVPSEKPCKLYGIKTDEWIDQTISTLKHYTDREIVIRTKAKDKTERRSTFTIYNELDRDIFALVTYNSIAALEAVAYGIPAFVQAPNAALSVSETDLSKIETPYYPEEEIINKWCRYIAYCQYNSDELKNGTALRIIKKLETLT